MAKDGREVEEVTDERREYSEMIDIVHRGGEAAEMMEKKRGDERKGEESERKF